MPYDKDAILEHWNDDEVESMADKYVVQGEIDLISRHIPPNAKILDAGCGEGEGTRVYARTAGATVQAVDFSETRLKKAGERLADFDNVTFKQVDFLADYELDEDYDVIVSQRLLINLTEWKLQKKALADFHRMLKPGGRLLMLEGSQEGVGQLNDFRAAYGLPPIPVRWHNLFFTHDQLVDFMTETGFELAGEDGLGAYFFLTRGIRPIYEEHPNWQSDFNKVASGKDIEEMLGLGHRFSRVKLWVFKKAG